MSCRVFEDDELISKYLNGQLDPAAVDQLELHILECPVCQEEVELFQTLREEVAERAHEIRSYSAPRGRLWWAWATVAALVLFASGVAVQRYLKNQKSGIVVAEHKAPSQNAVGPADRTAPNVSAAPPSGASLSNAAGGSETVRAGLPKPSMPSLPDRDATHQGDSAPLVPPSGANSENPPVLNSEVAVKPRDTVNATSSTTGKDTAAQTSTQAKASGSDTMSDESERELFRLSGVRAAPYDFSGLSPHAGIGDSPSPAGTRPSYGQSPEERRALFASAMRAYIDHNYEEAADRLQRYLKLEPNAPDANFYLGVVFLVTGGTDKAFEPLKSAAAEGHTRWTQPAHYYLAKAYLQTRDLASAETELAAAAAITGNLTASAKADLSTLRALRSRENR